MLYTNTRRSEEMRKAKWLVAFTIFVLALTGCGKDKNSGEVLNNAKKQMEALSNYAMKLEMKMGVKSAGLEMDFPIEMNIKVDEKTQTAKMDVQFEMLGMKISTEGYMQQVGNQTVTYTKEVMEDVWTKEYSETSSNFSELKNMTKQFSNAKQKKSDDKEAYLYQVSISKEEMKNWMQSMDSVGSTEAGEFNIDKDVVMDVYVNKKTNYITKMVMNLKEAIKMTEEETQITNFEVIMSFSDFNNVGTITIPEEVVTSAQEENDWNLDDLEENQEI